MLVLIKQLLLFRRSINIEVKFPIKKIIACDNEKSFNLSSGVIKSSLSH